MLKSLGMSVSKAQEMEVRLQKELAEQREASQFKRCVSLGRCIEQRGRRDVVIVALDS